MLLHYISQIFVLPPTKTRLYLVNSDQQGNKDILELQTKGTTTNRLVDLNIKDESEIVVHNLMGGESKEQIFKEISKSIDFKLPEF